MKKLFKLIILLLVSYFLASSYLYNKQIEKPFSNENEKIIFEVKSGDNVNTIARNLEEVNLISSKYYFEKYIKKEGIGASLQAGTYSLSPILSIKDIARVIKNGETLKKEKTIKFTEGWNMKDMNSYLKQEKILYNDEFLEIAKKNIASIKMDLGDYSFLDLLPQENNLEGFLFPDTYKIFNESSAKDILQRMLNNFDKKLTQEMREEIKKQNRSLYEVMILASIVEKEVRSVEDMKLVAGLFLNRIKNGQALESCATLAYILGVNKPQYSIEDTKINSPYNTYQNLGLPPGPICNPGINAIKASIYPTESNYNYFLQVLKMV